MVGSVNSTDINIRQINEIQKAVELGIPLTSDELRQVILMNYVRSRPLNLKTAIGDIKFIVQRELDDPYYFFNIKGIGMN